MAEKEYIERGALLESIRFKHKPVMPTGSLADVFCKSVEETIMEQPAADVVEVVRCKDCKWWQHEEDVDFVCTRHYGYRLSSDFCSYGERKEHDNV